MAGGLPTLSGRRPAATHVASDPPWVRRTLVAVAFVFVSLFLVAPLVVVFGEAFRQGARVWLDAVTNEQALAAVKLTLLVTVLVVPLNVAFGVAAAWLLARFRFPGRSALVALVELPFAVSPVVAGMLFVLLFGTRGWFGESLSGSGFRIVFAVPGIVVATAFVTLPFVARELIPLMEEQGADEEEAAVVLGAGAFATFWRVTLPKVRWGLLYGVTLCSARAMGEFGAVSVVSGHIRGETNTVPLEVEILYNEYSFASAFALASLLALFALAALAAKRAAEWRVRRELAARIAEARS